MGELAGDMANGRCCSHCMIYFIGEHGYPVVCRRCAAEWGSEGIRRQGWQRAMLPELVVPDAGTGGHDG
jgi:hypothetical protein